MPSFPYITTAIPPKERFVKKKAIAAPSPQSVNYQKLLRNEKKHSMKSGSRVRVYTETNQILMFSLVKFKLKLNLLQNSF